MLGWRSLPVNLREGSEGQAILRNEADKSFAINSTMFAVVGVQLVLTLRLRDGTAMTVVLYVNKNGRTAVVRSGSARGGRSFCLFMTAVQLSRLSAINAQPETLRALWEILFCLRDMTSNIVCSRHGLW